MFNYTPNQYDLFGNLADARTRRQRYLDMQRAKPQPIEMFAPREVLQFGVNGRPLIPISDTTKLELEIQDPRTDEERERDWWRAAEAATVPMFDHQIGDYACKVLIDLAEALLGFVEPSEDYLDALAEQQLGYSLF
ncbi:MAG: hypothetical protein DYG88_07320 [Chloroflexi bacterium CFX4]|nr:hypothetical protein [Chloroflexi bacterium CFX4]MDL1921977.1 hypothetical protein [Chloroflexi bacterium CFX3]